MKMQHFTYNIVELKNALRILKKDVSEFRNQIEFNHIDISDSSKFSRIKTERDYRLSDCKLLDTLNSCYFYLIALTEEAISFCNTLQCPCNITIDETHAFTSEKFLKEYFQEFNVVVHKKYIEIDSLCALLMNYCKTINPCEAQEVMEAFKISLEDYQTAVTVEWSHPMNTENLLNVLENVKTSTRRIQSYLWMIKTMTVHNSPFK